MNKITGMQTMRLSNSLGGTGKAKGKGSTVIGINIGHDKLYMVKVAHQGGTPVLAGAVAIPFTQGTGPASPHFSSFLGSKFNEFAGKDRNVEVWSQVPTAQVDIFTLRIPKVAPAKISETIYWAAMKEKAFTDDAYIFDYELHGDVLEKGITKMQCLAYTVPRQVVSKLQDVMRAANIKISGITVAPIALQSIFRANVFGGGGQSCAAVHIGKDWSRIDIFSNGNLVMSRGINTGASSFAAALTEEYNVVPVSDVPGQQRDLETSLFLDGESAEEADFTFEFETPGPQAVETIPHTVGQNPSMTEAQALKVFMSRVLNTASAGGQGPGEELTLEDILRLTESARSRLVKQIERTLEHYTSSLGAGAVQQVLFSGEISTNNTLLESISSELGVPCILLDPLGVLSGAGASSVADPVERLSYNLAVGLALCSTETTPNILQTFKEKDVAKREEALTKKVVIAVAAALLLLVGYYFFDGMAVQKLNTEFNVEKTNLSKFPKKVTPEEIRALTMQVGLKQAVLRQVSKRYEGLALINEISLITPSTVRLTLMDVFFDDPDFSSRSQDNSRRMRLEGIIQGERGRLNGEMAAYMDILKKSPLFEPREIVLEDSVIENVPEKGNILKFKLDVVLKS